MPSVQRRDVLAGMAGLTAAAALPAAARRADSFDLRAIERRRVVPRARHMLGEVPRTVTAIPAPRSPAGAHDYYSEGDYWWPDPAHPEGPYIRLDGRSNADKFDGHRDALIAFGRIVPMLAAAWNVTGEAIFAHAAIRHLRAWFVDPATRMTPNLLHAQAIIGVNTGRAIGIIDTLQIIEVARAATMFAQHAAPGYAAIRGAVEDWFADYLEWLTGSAPGREERDQRNNHGTCWLLQVASFAAVLGRHDTLDDMRARLTDIIIPVQIATDGSQPLELARTKPYGYSLFNLDVLVTAAWLLSKPSAPLVEGRVTQAIAYMAPFIADKRCWPHAHDIEFFEDFPVRQPSLLFGGLAAHRADWLALWQRLDADPVVGEVVRNFPVRQPLLWVDPQQMRRTAPGRQSAPRTHDA